MVKQNQESKQANVYYPPQSGDLLEEFERTHPTYKLFKEKGIDKIPDVNDSGEVTTKMGHILNDGLFRGVRRFLNNVDLSKGPIQRKVIKLERRRGLNPETNKIEENLVIHTHWVAQDFLGNTIAYDDVREGLYNKPIIATEIINGKRVTRYSNWKAVYDIPFTAEAVNEALENQINPIELVNYFVRFNANRDGSFSLEQFRDTTWEQCREISTQGKGLNR